jgi:hypothetical protein
MLQNSFHPEVKTKGDQRLKVKAMEERHILSKIDYFLLFKTVDLLRQSNNI